MIPTTTSDFWGMTTVSDGKKIYVHMLVELLATFHYVFLGIASTLIQDYHELAVAISFGFTAASLVLAFGHHSGSHINPAITLGLILSSRIGVFRGIMYILMQFLGALVASVIIIRIRNDDSFGMTKLHEGVTPLHGICIECVITMLLVLVFLAVTDPCRSFYLRPSSPIAIGLSVMAGHMAGFRFTGASMNPVRSFGPDVVHGDFTFTYIYFVGPILGSILAAVIYKLMLRRYSPKLSEDDYDYEYDWC